MPTKTQVHPDGQHRNSILEAARIACGRAIRGRSARSMMLLGLRRTGKTTLLNEIGEIAQEEGLLVSRLEALGQKMPAGNLAHLLYPEMRKVMQMLSDVELARPTTNLGLQGFYRSTSAFKDDLSGMALSTDPEPGLDDSGGLQYDLSDLVTSIGRATQAVCKGWLLLIDEVQDLSREDLAALITAIYRTNQECLPVLLVGAGLPEVARLAGDAKPYAERLFLYANVGPLTPENAQSAKRRSSTTRPQSIARW